MESDAYLLGTHQTELQRLALQDRLWQDQTTSLWDRAGLDAGQTVLELGCGPGFSTLQLAARVGPKGQVLAWDRSAAFLEHLRDSAAASKVDWISTHQGDVLPEAPSGCSSSFDLLYSRWLLCWMERPEDALQLAWQVLRPGGRIALFDYFHYDALELFPKDPAFRRGIEAVHAAWRAAGGDPSLGTRLASLLEAQGFMISSSALITRSTTPEQPLWNWPMSFFPEFLPQLAQDGHLTEAEANAFLQAFANSAEHPQGHFLTPPMLSIVAQKPT